MANRNHNGGGPLKTDLTRIQDYLEWLKTKIYLDSLSDKAKTRALRRGEVYKCNLGKGIGSEEEKERPCIVLQNDVGNKHSGNTIIAPITHTAGIPSVSVELKGNYTYLEAGKEKQLTGYVLLANIMTVSKSRITGSCLANIRGEMDEIEEKVMVSLGMFKKYKDLLDKKERDKAFIKRLLQENYALKEKLDLYERPDSASEIHG
ncbi:type II toxin-antitoxin system PemK/MazF family toxin [Paenibacillus chitinolyticus]|uniref:type II toxin-antitoxin system PemK/MazF family toxin n=1 Tax=Paenibacillus TaxID=44249 RepID=UPI0020C72954|nr:type II toxin-antitoxin system PemK/MazF family toxin [Paenibacillus sp. GbtcB18]